jgi:hypothetical protein
MVPFNYSAYMPTTDGNDYFLCVKRGKPITANPEEFVRQAILKYLTSTLKIGITDINVEYVMSKMDDVSKRRADILVSSYGKVILVIECKASEIYLTDDILHDQAMDYANSARNPEIIWITNGYDNKYYGFDGDQGSYLPLKELPDIRDPKSMIFRYLDKKFQTWVSPTIQQLKDPKYFKQFEAPGPYEYDSYLFDGDNPLEARGLIIRIFEWLFYGPKLPNGTKLGPYEVLSDMGVKTKNTSTPSGFRYTMPNRSLSVKHVVSGELLTADIALIVLNQEREVHLAIRISPKGTGSFTIQAAIDHKIEGRAWGKEYRFFHNPRNLQMGGNYLGLAVPDYLREIDNNLLSRDKIFYGPWLNITQNPKENPDQYLAFLSRWLQYAGAIYRMKADNKQLKPSKEQKSSKPNYVAEAKKMARNGQSEDGVLYILKHLPEVGRKKEAIEAAFYMAVNGQHWELAEKCANLYPKASHDYNILMAINNLKQNKIKEAWKFVQKSKDPEKNVYYWEIKFYAIGQEIIPGTEYDLINVLSKALQLNPNLNALRIELIKTYFRLWQIPKALQAFDELNNYLDVLPEQPEFILVMLNQFGPFEKRIPYCKSLLEHFPEESKLWHVHLAEAYLLKGDYQKAYESVEIAMKLYDETDLFTEEIRFLIKWRLGKTKEAYDYFLGIKDDPTYELYLFAMAKALGLKKEALEHKNIVLSLLQNFEGERDLFFHAPNIYIAFFIGDTKALENAIAAARKEMVRLDGIWVYGRFMASGFGQTLEFEQVIAKYG